MYIFFSKLLKTFYSIALNLILSYSTSLSFSYFDKLGSRDCLNVSIAKYISFTAQISYTFLLCFIPNSSSYTNLYRRGSKFAGISILFTTFNSFGTLVINFLSNKYYIGLYLN